MNRGGAARAHLQLNLLVGVFLHFVGRKLGRRGGRGDVALEHNVDFGVGLGERDARLQARDRLQPDVLINIFVGECGEEIRAGVDGGLHGDGNPNVRRFTDGFAEESGRSDADDLKGRLIDFDPAGEYLGIEVEAATPESVTDHGDGRRVAHMIDFEAERAAEDGLDA